MPVSWYGWILPCVFPLTELLSMSKAFVWSPGCDNAFNAAKDLLCSSSAPDFLRPFKLVVNASALGAGAVLLQETETGIDHPVCFFSKKFSKTQQRYSTIEKEALALLLPFSILRFMSVVVHYP
ncbi:hypothetical protein QQF64_018518 [Cirrhinus molitorella]|uniref:Reverse transcriptase/retrotransposon-derived protein RNase H-like domain-containing protein n=1 Tax=Cirrhinus molitorella TaxID=172907 RepID=A0ABR3LGB6_9TELE